MKSEFFGAFALAKNPGIPPFLGIGLLAFALPKNVANLMRTGPLVHHIREPS
jgi:hypothetical protein